MFTVPVSGHVCSTACDSLRIRTHVRPVCGNEWDTCSTTVAPARRRAAQKTAMISAAGRLAKSVHPARSTEYKLGGTRFGIDDQSTARCRADTVQFGTEQAVANA